MTQAELYDLDGPIIVGSDPFPSDAVATYYDEEPTQYVPPPIVPVNRKIHETYLMSPREVWNFASKSKSSVAPEMFDYLWDRKADVFGNTGRPNTRPWVNMTMKTLEKGHVDTRFKDIFFRPERVSRIQSKGAGIAELVPLYDEITFYDDDPWIIFGLARLFEKIKKVEFRLVLDLKSGFLLSAEEQELFPNVQRIAQLKYVEPKTMYVARIPMSERPVELSYFEARNGVLAPQVEE